MTTANNIVKYQDSVSGADVSLSVDIIKREICPKATDMEAAQFLRLCQYMGLNPFIRDAYLIKYGDNPATMVTGKDAFTKRADSHPQYAGMESGVVVMRGEQLENRRGTLVIEGEKIVGGWARVERNDRKLPVETTVSMDEYNTGRSLWAKMPATMIEKVAIVKALRTAFPSTFSGLYDSAEMGTDLADDLEPVTPENVIIEPTCQGSIPPEIEDAKVEEIPEAGAVVEAQVQEIIESTKDMIETAAEASTTTSGKPYCEKHKQAFGKGQNQGTGKPAWLHPYTVEVNGESHQSWCISDAPVV